MAGKSLTIEEMMRDDVPAKAKPRSLSIEEMAADDPSASRAIKGNVPLDLMGEYKNLINKAGTEDSPILDAGTGFIDKITRGNLQYSPKWREQVAQSQMNSPKAMTIGGGAANAVTGLGTTILGPAGLPAALMMGGAQGGLEKPEGNLPLIQDLSERGGNAAKAAALTLGLHGGAKILTKGGDWAMQKAVGAKDYIEGMGNRMANEGLWGTKGMMRSQIDRPEGVNPGLIGKITDYLRMTGKLPAREASLDKIMPQVQGKISVVPSVDAISREGALLTPKNPGIPISSGNEEAVRQIEKRALEATARGSQNPIDSLDVARKIDRAAHDTVVPAGKLAKKLDRLDSGALRGELKNEAERQGLPEVRNLLGSEQALIHAKDALGGKQSLADASMKLAPRVGAVAGGTYYATRNPIASILAAMVATPAGMSTMGQIGTQLPKAVPYLTPAMIDAYMQKNGGQK